MEVVLYVLGLAATGLLVGALARLVLPGRDPMTLFQTMLVGVAGSLIAGLITYYAFDRDAGPGLLLSLLCAVAIVYAVRKLRERQLGPQATSRAAPSGVGTTQVHFMPGCLIGSLVISLILTLALNLLIRAF